MQHAMPLKAQNHYEHYYNGKIIKLVSQFEHLLKWGTHFFRVFHNELSLIFD